MELTDMTPVVRVRSVDHVGHHYALGCFGDVMELTYLLLDENVEPVWVVTSTGMVMHDNEIALYFDNPHTLTVAMLLEAIDNTHVNFAIRQIGKCIAENGGW